MPDTLDYFGQQWAAAQPGELTLFLNHSELLPEQIHLSIEMGFVPAWKLARDEDGDQAPGECRTLQLSVSASMSRTGDWRALRGLHVEQRDEVAARGEIISPEVFAPEIDVYSFGHGPIHTHLQHLWETSLTFGQQETRDPYLLPFQIAAFCPSDRARAASAKLGENEIKSWFGEPVPEDFESMELAKEGRWFRFAGHCRFDRVFCNVPVNSAEPIAYAQAMVRRTLKLEEWGFCYVNGGDCYLGTWEPKDGLAGNGGRLVLVNTITGFYRMNADRIRASARARVARRAAENPPPPGEGKSQA
ncbi:MAG: hypothetical protein HY301_08850 [Verrucomicrobia bacterium]|nr:hypothetical protein [Verrucomicrobiota bacterium]